MDLSGTWRVAPVRASLRRTFAEPDLDDRDWLDLEVPGHWSRVDELATELTVLHRRRFSRPPAAPGRRAWLRFDGVASEGDVWLNGAYAGATDGYFVPHAFEITDLLADRSEHLLAVEVTCDRSDSSDERSSLMGAYTDPVLMGALAGTADGGTDSPPSGNPGGIWNQVRITETGSSAILHFRAVCAAASAASARISLRCVFDHPGGGSAVLRTTLRSSHPAGPREQRHEQAQPAAAGENRVEWALDVAEPDLWWPHSLGEQPLSDLLCELVVDGEVQDRRSCRIGMRSVSMRRWTLHVNGEPLFAKGVNMLPSASRPGDATPAAVADDVAAARRAGFDLIRTIAHVAHPALYDTADELGMLIWQDMPIRGRMARSVRGQARRQAREMVDLLGHHPSVALWCAHDEPFKRPPVPTATPPLVGQQRPSWNRTVLDTSVRRVLQRTDGSRPVVLHTGVVPHLPRIDGTTSSLWFGWHDRHVSDLGPALARLPRMGRFVTAFGAAGIDPGLAALNAADSVSDLDGADWQAIAAASGTDAASLHHLAPPAPEMSGADWALASRAAQADLLRIAVETLRRLKYRPTGGFCLHCLADASDAGGFGLLDRRRRPKPALEAVANACRPVIVVVDPIDPVAAAGSEHRLAVHAVSDLRRDVADARIVTRVGVGDGRPAVRGWAGEIAADSVALIGHIEVTVPPPGHELRIAVELDSPEAQYRGEYRFGAA